MEPNETQSLEVIQNNSKDLEFINLQPEQYSLEDIMIKAFESKLLPESIRTKEQAIIAGMFAKELGMKPLIALGQCLYILGGKPCLTARGMSILIRLNKGSYTLEKDFEPIFGKDPVQPVDYITTLICKRHDEDKEHKISFKWTEAAAMGLTSKDNWKKYPSRMMFARCLSKAAAIIFPDYTYGLMDVEDLESFQKK